MSKKAKQKSSAKKIAEKKPRIRVVSGEPETAATQEAPWPKTRKKAVRKNGTMSGLDAAAKVLTDAGAPLNAKEILERIQKANLWKTKGKTPQATLYAAIIREIAAKGDGSRFRKTERGHFASA